MCNRVSVCGGGGLLVDRAQRINIGQPDEVRVIHHPYIWLELQHTPPTPVRTCPSPISPSLLPRSRDRTQGGRVRGNADAEDYGLLVLLHYQGIIRIVMSFVAYLRPIYSVWHHEKKSPDPENTYDI